MKAGIIGLASSGKSTLMGTFISKEGKRDIGIVKVPDERLYKLEKIYSPKKTTPAIIQIEELPPVDTHTKEEKIKLLDRSKIIDLQIICIGGYRCYNEEEIIKEVSKVRFELIINDLDIITRRLEKLEIELKRAPKLKQEKESEINLLNNLKTTLEEEKFPLREHLNEKEKLIILNNYNFLTLKPSIYVINISEKQFLNNRETIEKTISEYLQSGEDKSPVLLIDAMTEADIMDMEQEDMETFLKEFGINEPSKDKIIKKVYSLLGLITFFTVGEDEVRAWNIHLGDTALKAAGAIHTDLARGFIRAEVVESENLLQLGSLNEARTHGKLRLEGKNYVVKDGDVVHILFNV